MADEEVRKREPDDIFVRIQILLFEGAKGKIHINLI
jgi:hypothetical protein